MTTFKMIPTGLVLVDDDYQRELDERWVEKRVDSFDARLLGALTVTPRNGHYTVIDGQHRLRLAQKVGIAEVPCVVVDTAAQADAASVFVSMNRERRSVAPFDIYRADLLAGDVTAMAMRDVLARHDYTLSGSNLTSRATITSVIAVRKAVKMYGPDVLDSALATITEAWGKDSPNARRAQILMGLFAVYAVYTDLDPYAFAKRVGRRSALYYIQEWTSATSRSAPNSRMAADGVMGEVLINGYNAGLRLNMLDELAFRTSLRSIGTAAGKNSWESREIDRLREAQKVDA